jgi:hypothetical protein
VFGENYSANTILDRQERGHRPRKGEKPRVGNNNITTVWTTKRRERINPVFLHPRKSQIRQLYALIRFLKTCFFYFL